MRLGHEKARRRDLARRDYDPIDSFRPRKPDRKKRVESGKVIRRLMHIMGPGFECGATWQWKSGQWTCIRSSELIPWMVGLNPDQAKRAMDQRKDWNYEWSNVLR